MRPMSGARRGEAAVAIALALAALALCVRLARGYFLADDFVLLATFGFWREDGELLSRIAGLFAGSIDRVHFMYRPLPYASYAANYVLAGGHAAAWIVVNLVLHVANATLAASLVSRLSRERTRAAFAGAMCAALVFFAFSPGWEVALWTVCRFDSFATFFTLLAGVLFLADRRAAALAATVAALLSKEAGAVAIVLVAVLAAWRPAAGDRARGWLRQVAPWIVTGAAYALARTAMFGSPTEVYRGVHPDLASLGHWHAVGTSAHAWAQEVFPGMPGLTALALLSALAVGVGVVLAARRDRLALGALAAMLAMLVLSLALLAPHVTGLETNGIGGRLFYQAQAFYAIAIGLAVNEAGLALASRRLAALVGLFAAGLLLLAHAAWGVGAVRAYMDAQRSMRDAARAIGEVAASAGPGFDLVILPDAYGRVPFGRNAQAGLMLPPVQVSPVSNALLVQTDLEIAALDAAIDKGLLASLRALPLREVIEPRTPQREWPRLVASRVWCWDAPARRMRELAVADAGPGTYSAALTRAYAASGCRDASRK
jgi:hypothetical protein